MYRMVLITVFCLYQSLCYAQEWRTETPSAIDRQYITDQRDAIDAIARRQLGQQLNGKKLNDLPILQQLLDKKLVKADQTRELQAMGIILGQLLKAEHGLLWVIYNDKLGRSRALQVPGINEFIFPATQISRRVEVGIEVTVTDIYRELEQAVTEIKNQPRLFR